MTISQKLRSIFICTIIGIIIVITINLVKFRSSLLEGKYTQTENIVKLSHSIIENYVNKAKNGDISTKQAKLRSIEAVQAARYGGGEEYLWISDSNPSMITHPVKQELNGTDLTKEKDSNGKYIFVEMVKIANDKGEGFIDYMWPKPGSEKPVPKISYIKSIPEWGWILGSGIYVDDVNTLFLQQIKLTMIFVTIICILLSILFILVAKKITNPIKYLSDNIGRMSSGDYSIKLQTPNKDEIGEMIIALDANIKKVSDVIQKIQISADSVNSAANDITSGSTDLANRTEHQASSLEKITYSMVDMTKIIKQNNNNSSEANYLSVDAKQIAEKGMEIIQKAINAMSNIETSSKKISDITGLIDSIAFQTNLLALNAAVEAARAGEAGKGFAVVAQEVRSLANQTATAAKEIKELVSETSNHVSLGAKFVNNAGTSLNEIVLSIKKMAELISKIAKDNESQNIGIEDVNNLIAQLDEFTQQNVALAEESNAASYSLLEQAKELLEQIKFFKISA